MDTGAQQFGISLGDHASSLPMVEGPDLDLSPSDRLPGDGRFADDEAMEDEGRRAGS